MTVALKRELMAGPGFAPVLEGMQPCRTVSRICSRGVVVTTPQRGAVRLIGQLLSHSPEKKKNEEERKRQRSSY
ncbi:unnamed protein product [Boreogadus saida]